jgi:acrosin
MFILDTGAPAGASIDPVSGLFSWTPDEADGPGTFTVTVRVTDDGTPNLDDFETIMIMVNEVNMAPVLGAIGDQEVDEGTELIFTASAMDDDLPANGLMFSLDTGAPAGASIDPVSGLFSWTPGEEQGPAEHVVTIRVSDDGTPGLDDFETITITVNEDATLDTGLQANDGLADMLRLLRNGGDLEGYLNGALVFVRAFADLTEVTVTGSTDDDTLIVDLSGGDPIPASGISYDGGGPADNDTLTLTGGTSDSLVYTAFDAHSGTVSVDGKVITYTGLEPIIDDLVVANREFVFGSGNDTINVTVDGLRTTVISPSSESVDFVNPTGPTDTVTIRSGDGDDTIVVTGTAGYALQVDAGTGDNSITSSVPVAGIITGTSGADIIEMYESAGEVIVSVNGSVSTLSGANSLIVNALEGADTITLHDLTVPVTVDAGGDIDTLNVDDTGDTGANEGTLSATGLTGFGIPDGIGYVALENLNIYLGAGDNTINVRSTGASTVIETGGGNDTINLGSQAPGSGGTLNRFVGSVTIDGGGDSDTLNVDDTADTDPNTGTLTATTLTGLGMQSGVGYSNIENLELSLGAGADTLTVSGTGFQTQTRGHG